MHGSTAAELAEATREIESLQADKLMAEKIAEDARSTQLDAERALKASEARFEEMRLRLEASERRIKEMDSALKLGATVGDENVKAEAEARSRVAELEEQLAMMEQATAARQVSDTASTQSEHSKLTEQLAAMKAEHDAAQAQAAKEKEELTAQLDQLREAGQALCGVYEDRLAGIEAEKLEIEEVLRLAETELIASRESAARNNITASSAPVDMSFTSPSAMSVDNENLRSEAEHMRGRLHSLEEQLSEARANLESELQTAKRRRQESGEAENNLRLELKAVREEAGSFPGHSSLYASDGGSPMIDRAKQAEARAVTKAKEIENALNENRSTLENERAELEGLRAESSTAPGQDEVRRLQRLLEAAKTEAVEAKARAQDLAEELRLNEEIHAESQALNQDGGSTPVNGVHSIESDSLDRLRKQHELELQKRDTEIEALNQRMNSLRPPTALNEETGGLRSPRLSKRSSESSFRSTATSNYGKDELTTLKEQIVGLKIIVNQLTEENHDVTTRNQALTSETSTLRSVLKGPEMYSCSIYCIRDAQSALQRTVEKYVFPYEILGL